MTQANIFALNRVLPAGAASVRYQVCVRCVMDTTDPEITFDAEGVCSHCHYFTEKVLPRWFPDQRGDVLLRQMIEEVKAYGKDKPYDSIIGISGGVDSSYLAVKALEWGLRPLVVHVDAGWNSELATKNIEQIITKLRLDLHTVVIDWQEMRELQLAFLHASLANQDVPQDHAIFAALYDYAIRNGVRYVLSGANFATESILPKAWGYSAMDLRLIKAVHRRFGMRELKSFPFVNFFQCYIGFPYLHRMKVLSPLNYIDYRKEDAVAYLERTYGWRYYGGKHYESRWTRFFQAYYLPNKFGFDKRRAHLSSLILAKLMTREEALKILEKPLYTSNELAEDKAFVAKKLGLTVDRLEELIALSPRHYTEYPNNAALMATFVASGRALRSTVRPLAGPVRRLRESTH